MEGMNESKSIYKYLVGKRKRKTDLFSRVTSYWSEWPPSKYLQIINTGEGVRERRPLHFWEKCKTGVPTMENGTEMP